MKLKFKDYEASGSPKEMAEFLWLTQPKVECQLPEDFSDNWIKDFNERMQNWMKEHPAPLFRTATFSKADDIVFGKMMDSFDMRPNKFDK